MATSDTLSALQAQMDEAAAALDFERARQLRDRIALIRGGASAEDASDADTAGLLRQQPGTMGLGSSVPRPTLPEGWVAPKKPDPMTRARSR